MIIDNILSCSDKVLILNYTKDMSAFSNYINDAIQAKYQSRTVYRINIENLHSQDLAKQLNNNSLFSQDNYIQLVCNAKPLLAQQNELKILVESLASSDQLTIVFNGLNKKELQEKWANNITAKAKLFNIDLDSLKPIIQYILKLNQLALTPGAINLLIELNQLNYPQLLQELKRLSYLYPSGSIIEAKTLQQSLIDNSNHTIYHLSNAYLAGDLSRSLNILDKLMSSTEDVILINWIILEDIRKLLKIKQKLKQGKQIANILQELYIWGEAKTLLPKANHRLKYSQLLEILDQSSYIDLAIKGLKNADIYQLLTKIILDLCAK